MSYIASFQHTFSKATNRKKTVAAHIPTALMAKLNNLGVSPHENTGQHKFLCPFAQLSPILKRHKRSSRRDDIT